jgi:hypothetical protein
LVKRNDIRGTLTVTSSTLSGNPAIRGGGIYNVGTMAVTDSRNTVFAKNTAASSPNVSAQRRFTGPRTAAKLTSAVAKHHAEHVEPEQAATGAPLPRCH